MNPTTRRCASAILACVITLFCASAQTMVQTQVLADFEDGGTAGAVAVTTANSSAQGTAPTTAANVTEGGSKRLRLQNTTANTFNGVYVTLPNAIPGPGHYLITADVKVDNTAGILETYGMGVRMGGASTALISDVNAGYYMDLEAFSTSAAAKGYVTIGASVQAPLVGSYPQALTIYFSTDPSGNTFNASATDGNFNGRHRAPANTWGSTANSVFIDNIKRIGPGNFGEERHLWISIGDNFTNQATLENQLVQAKTYNFNSVVILARYRANRYYRKNRDLATYTNNEPAAASSVDTTFDPVQYTIDRGRELGLRVYAAWSLFLVTDGGSTYPSYLPTDSVTWVYNAGTPRAMTTTDDPEGLWADVGIPALRAYKQQVLMDFVQNYDVDGIIFDRVRYAGSSYGYNPAALSAMGIAGIPTTSNAAFTNARREAVTTFLHDAYEAVTNLKPWMIIGSAPIAYANNLSSTYNSVYQYWPKWTSRPTNNRAISFGVQDLMMPQFYRQWDTSPPSTGPGANQTLMRLAQFGDIATFNKDFGLMPGANTNVVPIFYFDSTSDATDSNNTAAQIAQNICDTTQTATYTMNGSGIFKLTRVFATEFGDTNINRLTSAITTPCGVNVLALPPNRPDFLMKKNYDNTPPNAPSGVSVTNSSLGVAKVTWSTPAPAADGEVPSGYRIYRSTTNPPKPFYANLLNRTGLVSGNQFFDSTATGGTNYFYMVVAVDDYNNPSGASNVFGPIQIQSADVVIESRTSSGARTAAPTYSESATFSDSTAKSTAPSPPLVGLGSRFNTVIGSSAGFNPTISTDGFYDVLVTIPNSTNFNASSSFLVYRHGPQVTGNIELRTTNTAVVNNWQQIATNVFFRAGSAGSVGGTVFTNLDGNNSTGRRFVSDSVWYKFKGGGAATTVITNDFTTGSLEPNQPWSPFGFNTNGFAQPTYDSATGAYRANISTSPDRFRVAGIVSNRPEWMMLSSVGSGNYVRGKYFVYAGGQANPSALNTIPNMRIRVQNRFALNSMLEVANHSNDSTAQQLIEQDLRPSQNAARPSLYKVDYDPIEVPYLVTNAATEGVQRAFEAFSQYPQDNGFLACTESRLMTFPILALPPSQAPVANYAPSASDAGGLAVFNQAAELSRLALIPAATEGAFAQPDGAAQLPTYQDGNFGITLDSTLVASDRIGVAGREISSDGGTSNFASRVRVEPFRQYTVRWHLTSTQLTNQQAQIRLRTRSVKFSWSNKLEIGGAWQTGGSTAVLTANNAIAQQVVPGVGCQVPDKNGSENGGWYTMVVHSPLDSDIRADSDLSTPLSVSMPGLFFQPGTGVAQPSQRDFRLGLDVLDTISAGVGRELERGNVTLDEIQVRSYPAVLD